MLASAHERNAKRIHKAISKLQGLFIKIGQMLSIMTNFLPEAFLKQLGLLQDHVPPRPFSHIEKRFQEEFDGLKPSDVFSHFAEAPIASASIGQVHLAKLQDGTQVAVKVQYPDIEKVVRCDLLIFRRIFRIAGYFLQYEGLSAVYRQIHSMVLEELDFHHEAQNTHKVAAFFEQDPPPRSDVAFPQVFPRQSSKRVLTTKFEPGCKVNDHKELDRLGIDKPALARQIVSLYCEQIFTHGTFHADPHPGNILARRDGSGTCVVFLDFGAVAVLPSSLRQGLAELLSGALTQNTDKVIQALRNMGFVSRSADDRVFKQVVDFFHKRFHEQISVSGFHLEDIRFDAEQSLEDLADLKKMNLSIRDITKQFHVPKEWPVLERTVLLLIGLCTDLDPSMNPMTVISPYVEKFLLGEDGDWSTILLQSGKDLALSAATLPADLKRLLRTMDNGELRVQFDNLETATNKIHKLGKLLLATLLGTSFAGFAVAFEQFGQITRSHWAWTGALACGLYLMTSVTSVLLKPR